MTEIKSLREFLDNPARQASGSNWTHTSLIGGKAGGTGRYFITEDDRPKFYELYVDSLEVLGDRLYLTERSSDIGPLRIDFDFIYDESTQVKRHLHTRAQVISFCKAYMTEMKQHLHLPESVDIYIMEKKRPTLDAKKQRIKSGIHIVVPSVLTHKYIEQSVRRALVPRMDEFFKGLPLNDTWEKVYDEAVLNRSQPWTMYGSRKGDEGALPYLTSYILTYKDDDLTVNDTIPGVSVDLIKTLSLHRDQKDETQMTDTAKANYEKIRTNKDGRDNGGEQRKRSGRLLQRSEKPNSRGSSPAGRILQPLTAEKKDYLKEHVLNFDKSRYQDYDKWVQVGICLNNIHPDLLDVFLDFSSQWKDYNESDSIQKWNSLPYRNDGDRLGEPTIRYWSREDHREGYDEIEKNNVERLIMLACSGTEFDVASVIYAKFRDHYKCSDFRYNVWYRWMGHVWKETDQGVDLQLKLSKQIAGVFFDRMTSVQNEMNQRGITSCTGTDKSDCKVCEYCKMETTRTDLNKIFTHLKTTKFKGNVMKECRELFFDEQFNKKVDSNKDLIAFNNGVLELDNNYLFRPGKPEDYMSFTTGIDYDPGMPYYEYPAWPKVDTFIKRVLADPEVREYFIKHLASNLFGGNPAQKFHILTGTGSNGKSMITNLMTAAMGEYACTVPISLLTQNRKSSGSAAPEVARLKGRRFVTMQEPDEKIALNTGQMKEISSGEKMYARDLFKSGGEFEVLAKFHLACNDKPKVNTTDGGTWRRLVVINFTSKFVQTPSAANEFPLDESIQFSVNTPEWATCFLAYLVHVLKEGKGLRKLVAPQTVLLSTSDYRNDNDAIAKFITEMISVPEEGEETQPVEKKDLKRVFKTWKDENDQRSLAPADMEKRIVEKFGKCSDNGWSNFKLKH
jgi:P4 family phage/plasmid primase-like protien